MLDEKRITYQAKTRVLTYRVPSGGRGAVSVAEEKALQQLARAGIWGGQPVAEVVVDFAHDDAWQYHRDALAYLGLASEFAGKRHAAPGFGERADFGLQDPKGHPKS